MEVIRTDHLSKVYGTHSVRVEALKSVDITIHQGEFIAVVGASGSGKSTLLHLLGGLDRPSEGRVFVDGKDMYMLPEKELAVLRRRRFGFVFQFFNLIPVLSAEENIMMPLLLDHNPIDHNYIDELMSLLGLQERRRHFPNAMSGGQQQRVSIARALANKPSVIFADEPTGNLDSRMGREVMELLRLSIQKYHQTLVLVTHDPQAAALADRVITMEDGRIIDDRGERR